MKKGVPESNIFTLSGLDKKINKFQKKLFWDSLVTTAMHQDDNENEYENDLWDDHGDEEAVQCVHWQGGRGLMPSQSVTKHHNDH